MKSEITYPFTNFNGCTVEVWEWISNFIPHFTGHVITYPCRYLSLCLCVLSFLGYVQLLKDWRDSYSRICVSVVCWQLNVNGPNNVLCNNVLFSYDLHFPLCYVDPNRHWTIFDWSNTAWILSRLLHITPWKYSYSYPQNKCYNIFLAFCVHISVNPLKLNPTI